MSVDPNPERHTTIGHEACSLAGHWLSALALSLDFLGWPSAADVWLADPSCVPTPQTARPAQSEAERTAGDRQ